MDPMSSSIPIMRSPADLMTYGPNGDNFAASAVQAHPIDRMQRARTASSSASLDLDSVRRLYGSALAMRLSTERKLASQVGGRLPGMDSHPNSNAMLETLTGEDVTVDLGDFLNVVENRAESSLGGIGGRVVDSGPHSAIERRLGL